MTGSVIELDIERAVAGGRMLARHQGRVIFVAGAIPGERVRARVTRTSRQAWWADTVDVLTPSADRRAPACDPACGGLAFAHVGYERQRALKAQILADAFRHLARLDLASPVVAPSPETAYRLRARLHVRDGRAGFFLEGTHTLCDAGATRQLTDEAIDAVEAIVRALGSASQDCEAIVVSENIDGTERVLHFEPRHGGILEPSALAAAAGTTGHVTGVTSIARGRLVTVTGRDTVSDSASSLLDGAAPQAIWRRRPTSFFQGNRFLTGHLVRRVLALAGGGRIADLYAGVGLFTVALASKGATVVAVEGDASAAEDLAMNAVAWGKAVQVSRAAIEEYLRRPPAPPPDAVIVDPPRTGMSADALDGLAAWGPTHLVYVSCDPATLARDAARLANHGFRMVSIEGVDLFPNTPHVESIAAFVKP